MFETRRLQRSIDARACHTERPGNVPYSLAPFKQDICTCDTGRVSGPLVVWSKRLVMRGEGRLGQCQRFLWPGRRQARKVVSSAIGVWMFGTGHLLLDRQCLLDNGHDLER